LCGAMTEKLEDFNIHMNILSLEISLT